MSAELRQGTHWEGCWAAHGHHECAAVEVAAWQTAYNLMKERAHRAGG
jgi:hypothetical protein